MSGRPWIRAEARRRANETVIRENLDEYLAGDQIRAEYLKDWRDAHPDEWARLVDEATCDVEDEADLVALHARLEDAP